MAKCEMSAISHDNPQLSPSRTMNHFPALQSRLENIKEGSALNRTLASCTLEREKADSEHDTRQNQCLCARPIIIGTHLCAQTVMIRRIWELGNKFGRGRAYQIEAFFCLVEIFKRFFVADNNLPNYGSFDPS